MIGQVVSDVLAAIVCMGIGVQAIVRLLNVKATFRQVVIVLPLAAVGIIAGWRLLALPDYYMFVLEAVVIALISARVLGADGRLSLFLAVLYEIGVYLWQYLMTAWLAVCFRSYAFFDTTTLAHHIAMWIFLLLLGALAWYVHKQRPFSRKQAMGMLDVVVVAGFTAAIALSAQPFLKLDDGALGQCVLLSFLLMVGVLLFMMRHQVDAERELVTLREAQAESAAREYKLLSDTYAENARLFHDLHNHLGVLRHLLEHGKLEEATRYIDDLQAPFTVLTQTVWTGDETVDYLIVSKAQQAETVGVRFTAEVEFPQRTNLRAADLCTILGNLLENAIRGAVETVGEHWLRLVIRRVGSMLVIKVENSAQAPHPDLATTKEDAGLHGWGIKSTQTAADRYEGVVQTDYADGVFTVVVTLVFDAVACS